MRKFFKILGILLMVLIIAFVGFMYSIKGKVSLYKNIVEKYVILKDNPPAIEDINSLEPSEAMNYKDVTYKNTNDVALTLDIYGPKKQLKKGSPVILYVHGGSWVYGDKSIPKILSPLLDAFREEGFTIISTSYELMRREEIFGKQVSDVKDTIRWIHKNKNVYNFDTENIGVIGMSSGAHLALMAAYTDNDFYKDDYELKDQPSTVKYVIDFFGPTNLNTLDMTKAGWDLEQVIKSAEKNKSKEEVFEEYSPINYVKEKLPKTLIVHSKGDEIVPYSNSTSLYEKLIEYNNVAEILTLNSGEHDLKNTNGDEVIMLFVKILNFIVRNSPI